MNLRKLIEQYLKEARLMQLATSSDNQPWVCSVWFAADENLNIYWFSSTTRRHSQEIMKNQKVAAAIVLPQTPEDQPRGLQLQGVAELLTNQKDIEKAVSVYSAPRYKKRRDVIASNYKDRIFPQETIKEFMQSKSTPHRFYRIKPALFVLFDLVNFPNKPRQEYKMPKDD